MTFSTELLRTATLDLIRDLGATVVSHTRDNFGQFTEREELEFAAQTTAIFARIMLGQALEAVPGRNREQVFRILVFGVAEELHQHASLVAASWSTIEDMLASLEVEVA